MLNDIGDFRAVMGARCMGALPWSFTLIRAELAAMWVARLKTLSRRQLMHLHLGVVQAGLNSSKVLWPLANFLRFIGA